MILMITIQKEILVIQLIIKPEYSNLLDIWQDK